MRIGPEDSIEDILHKLDSIYGTAANTVDILKELLLPDPVNMLIFGGW
jgi:hypothetical protein